MNNKKDIEFNLVGHASFELKIKNRFHLLTDPWFLGTCFNNGWSLPYMN